MRIIRENKGFTLLELIVALVILITIIPLSSHFVNSLRATNKTKIQQTANNLAQEYMEEFKGKSLGDLFSDLDPDIPDRTVDGVTYKINVAIASLPGTASEGVNKETKDIGTINVTENIASNTLDINIPGCGTAYTASAVSGNPYDDLYLVISDGSIVLKDDLDVLVDPLRTGSISSFDDSTVEVLKLNTNVSGNPDIKIFIKSALGNQRLEVNTQATPSIFKGYEGVVDFTIGDAPESQQGANITVTIIKGSDELVKVAQTKTRDS